MNLWRLSLAAGSPALLTAPPWTCCPVPRRCRQSDLPFQWLKQRENQPSPLLPQPDPVACWGCLLPPRGLSPLPDQPATVLWGAEDKMVVLTCLEKKSPSRERDLWDMIQSGFCRYLSTAWGNTQDTQAQLWWGHLMHLTTFFTIVPGTAFLPIPAGTWQFIDRSWCHFKVHHSARPESLNITVWEVVTVGWEAPPETDIAGSGPWEELCAPARPLLFQTQPQTWYCISRANTLTCLPLGHRTAY